MLTYADVCCRVQREEQRLELEKTREDDRYPLYLRFWCQGNTDAAEDARALRAETETKGNAIR